MSVAGMFLPCGVGAQPVPVLVGDVADIQSKVGGVFDCVTAVLSKDDNSAIVVGYINDMGALDGSELNYLATALFQRELAGDVVVVWGCDENGQYDGENHDLPEQVSHWMCTHLLDWTAERYNEAIMLHAMLSEAVSRGLATDAEVTDLKNALYAATHIADEEALKEAEEVLMTLLNRLSDSMSVTEMLELLDMFSGNNEEGE